MYNSKTVWPIWTICTLNNYSTIRDFPYLGWSCMQAKISKLWPQTCITVSFWYAILYILTHIAWQLRPYMDILHIEQLFYYQRCVLPGLELHARYDWWVMAPNMDCSLFPVPHLCVLPCITWKLQIVHRCSKYWTTALLWKTFLELFRVAWNMLMGSYGPRHTSQSFSDTTLSSVYCKLIHTSLFGGYITTHDNKTHLSYDCIPYTKQWLYWQWLNIL